jgi:hypothetical protein
MAAKKSPATPIDKAYTMFGRGEWVAESGKVRETRLIKELVEFAETAGKERDKLFEKVNILSPYKWRYEYAIEEKEKLQAEIKELKLQIQGFNLELDEIAEFAYSKRK